MKIKTTLAVLATLALLVACTAPPQVPVQVEVLNADEFGLFGPAGATERGSLLCATEDGNCVESWNGSDIVVYSDTGSTEKFSVDGATGNVVLAGGLTVTGGITGTNVLTTGDQTIAGVKTFTTPAAFTGGVTGPLVMTGPTAVATATPAAYINNLGAANDSLVVANEGTVVAAIGNAGALTADSAAIGGGYGATGCTLSNAGALQCNGAATVDGALDVGSTLNFGANNLYPVGYASSGQQLVYGSSTITGTLAVPHGLTTVTFCQATLGEDPETGAGDAAFVTVAVAANVCTAKVWQDSWTDAATETDVVVHWLVIGAP